jgi:Fe-S-cluster containining protein
MPPKDFECKQCGNCCLNLLDAFCTSVPEEDIELWEIEGREDILAWVVPLDVSDGEIIGYDIWISPKTGEEVQRCPWLRRLPKKDKYICRIHDVKPRHCRAYPKSRKHAEETGCKGFEGYTSTAIRTPSRIATIMSFSTLTL